MKKFIKKLNIVPSWFIFILDILTVILASFLAVFLRDNFQFLSKTNFNFSSFFFIVFIIVTLRIIIFLLFKINHIVVRYTKTKDIAKIFWCCFVGSISLIFLNFISYLFQQQFLVPTSIVIMEFFITTFSMVFYRLTFKLVFLETVNPAKHKQDIIIIGAGEAGMTTKRVLDRDRGNKYNTIAFFDDDTSKIGKTLENVPVFPISQLSDYLKKNEIFFLIIAIQHFPVSKKNEITNIALQYRVKVLVVPPVSRWINGELSFKQLKKIKIEELLEREEIVINKTLIDKEIEGKTILITGAAGSIGSEIVKQLLEFNYHQLILIDNAETPTFYLINELLTPSQAQNVEVKIMDICDTEKMEAIFSTYRPQLIYHAAAYKHVPLMEENVSAAIKTNVNGTKQLADLAVKYKVNKFVMISTDKAVNPTNVMGASKRIAEMYVQSLNFHQNECKFITTRFGNVLDSNGSVIPIFTRQIENGGPITVTHPEITRYFMTISEACQLVIHAGAMGEGGEIFVFDMGNSIKIYDLAKKMILLSGLTLNKDITIEFSGLRPGEKLYEELLADNEKNTKTEHKKILIAQVTPIPYETIKQQIEALITIQNDTAFNVVAKMKEIVPEYISKNSIFESLNLKN
ncbi:MAG TPA: nucleoside-diphosphate sugar epimerase/dehydratase [Bacteroidales bacterium]|nr:nucleoside-diphosphate sugar epimerase/dehydratase [Bacteroidales bacterium]